MFVLIRQGIWYCSCILKSVKKKIYSKLETKNRIKGKVRDFFTHSNPLAFRFEMAHRVKEINLRLEKIENEKEKFMFDANLVLAHSQISRGGTVNRETASFVIDSEVVERQDDKSKIIDMLLHKGNAVHEIFSVIPIVGFGGLGKPTLAQLLYNDMEVGKKFDLKMWVWLSNNFDVKRVIREMMESIFK
ncbi:hypothetical protein Scep_014320 [Stephania cephalantha]|uniref:NB-ARC domain-containing protein n=1 Tax=Stephania cephalantha TaxID=152367 RepID=A0AAP0J117_9MAGN